MNAKQVIINKGNSYKVGVDEVVGLKDAMQNVMQPILNVIREKAYWDSRLEFDVMEYKSRDGFIPYSSNCGGVVIALHVPECEQYDWGFLEFGEMTEEYTRNEDRWENEGELDAYLRIILKFEGIGNDGNMSFYINVSGGNNDAPYFRINQLPDLYEGEFTCKSIAGLKRRSAKHVRAILKLVGAV